MSELTQRLNEACANRTSAADFDLCGELESVLAGLGLAADDAGGTVSYTGADPVLSSLLRSAEAPQLPPVVVVNDYLACWIAQTGVVAALRRRAQEGGSYHVHVSLTRIALWMLSLGIFDKSWAYRTAGSSEAHRYLEPETFAGATPLGDYQGVTDQVAVSLAPGTYNPILLPRGSSRAEWL